MNEQTLNDMILVAGLRIYGNGPYTIQQRTLLEAALLAAMRIYDESRVVADAKSLSAPPKDWTVRT